MSLARLSLFGQRGGHPPDGTPAGVLAATDLQVLARMQEWRRGAHRAPAPFQQDVNVREGRARTGRTHITYAVLPGTGSHNKDADVLHAAAGGTNRRVQRALDHDRVPVYGVALRTVRCAERAFGGIRFDVAPHLEPLVRRTTDCVLAELLRKGPTGAEADTARRYRAGEHDLGGHFATAQLDAALHQAWRACSAEPVRHPAVAIGTVRPMEAA